LPSPLDGPILKVERARTLIKELRAREDMFRRDVRFEIVPDDKQDEHSKFIYRLHVDHLPELGFDWGITIGEVAHDLRSALDNLTWQLALLNTPAPGNWTQFPIFDAAAGFKKRRSTYVGSLSTAHQKALEKLQPYQPDSPNCLPLLAKLNDADKHRTIHVVGGFLAGFAYGGWGDHPPASTALPPLETGAEVVRLPFGEIVVPKGPCHILFSEDPASPLHQHGVCLTLSTLADYVSTIMTSFAVDF
jgi:hypothetical protein